MGCRSADLDSVPCSFDSLSLAASIFFNFAIWSSSARRLNSISALSIAMSNEGPISLRAPNIQCSFTSGQSGLKGLEGSLLFILIHAFFNSEKPTVRNIPSCVVPGGRLASYIRQVPQGALCKTFRTSTPYCFVFLFFPRKQTNVQAQSVLFSDVMPMRIRGEEN